jgi:hypothetical protein
MISREDQIRVQTDDGEIWDRMSELELGMHDQELTLEAAGLSLSVVDRWLRRVDKKCAILVSKLNEHAMPAESYAVSGTVKGVRLSPYDAASAEARIDRIVIEVTKVVMI